MILFTTARLEIRQLSERDLEYFIELFSDPDIIRPIPQPKKPLKDILSDFNVITKYATAPNQCHKTVWGVYIKNQKELIGLCALLTNNENQREIGYRFRKKYWGKGYATELTKHFIHYCFTTLNLDVLTADVNVQNKLSVNILEKFFQPLKEFYNTRDQCTDRRYILHKTAPQL